MAAVMGDSGSETSTADVEGPESGSDAGEPAVPSFNITFGEGPGSIEDHVVVAKEFYALTGPPGEQEGTLLRVSEPNATETSRLAACIKLTKEMDGLTVLVPETNADLTNLL